MMEQDGFMDLSHNIPSAPCCSHTQRPQVLWLWT